MLYVTWYRKIIQAVNSTSLTKGGSERISRLPADTCSNCESRAILLHRYAYRFKSYIYEPRINATMIPSHKFYRHLKPLNPCSRHHVKPISGPPVPQHATQTTKSRTSSSFHHTLKSEERSSTGSSYAGLHRTEHRNHRKRRAGYGDGRR